MLTVGNNPSDAAFWKPVAVAVAVALALAAALLLVLWLALNAPVTPRVGQLAFLAVLAFLLTTKVWSPQYSPWLVPLLALARPRLAARAVLEVHRDRVTRRVTARWHR